MKLMNKTVLVWITCGMFILALSSCDSLFGPWTNPSDPGAQYKASLVLKLPDSIGGLTAMPGKGVVYYPANDSSGVVTEYDQTASGWSSPLSVDLHKFSYSFWDFQYGPDGNWYCYVGGDSPGFARYQPTTAVTTVLYPKASEENSHFTVDKNGGVYISEPSEHRIMRIGADGIKSVFAGTGVQGNPGDGDGGQATSAKLCGPGHLALGPDNSLYFEDYENYGPPNQRDDWPFKYVRLRKISPSGVLSTVLFNGTRNLDVSEGYPGIEANNGSAGDFRFDIDNEGSIIFDDGDGFNIWKMPTDGNLYRIAGRSRNDLSAQQDWSATSWEYASDIVLFLGSDGAMARGTRRIAVDKNNNNVYLVNETSSNGGPTRIIALTRR